METINSRKVVNKEVEITAWYFRNKHRFQSFPKRMEYDNQVFTFAEGLRYLVQKGKQVVQFFDMTDGTSNYRLKFDEGEQTWTLVSVSRVARAGW